MEKALFAVIECNRKALKAQRGGEVMYSFETFGLRQMIESSRAIRQLGSQSSSMEDAAREVVAFFFDSFLTPSGQPACCLVRCFKTHRYSDLPQNLRAVASSALNGARPDESMACLTLLATRGVDPAWNSRHTSTTHQAIPLATAEMVSQAPMIARLIQQMGLQPQDIVEANAEQRVASETRNFEVFHVEHAAGSPFIPAQAAFVQPFGVRSVLGFGGVFPTGDLFFVLMFTVVPIRPETAAIFRTLALCVKLVLLAHMEKPVFAE